MNSILVVDTTFDGSSFTNASMTGEQIINFLKEKNYEVVPILRVTTIPGRAVASDNSIKYMIISAPCCGYSQAEVIEELPIKRNLFVSAQHDGEDLFIKYDTGEIYTGGK